MNPTSIAPTPPYKALIFDCDGTLADTLPIVYEDTDTGLEAAHRVGMRSIHVTL